MPKSCMCFMNSFCLFSCIIECTVCAQMNNDYITWARIHLGGFYNFITNDLYRLKRILYLWTGLFHYTGTLTNCPLNSLKFSWMCRERRSWWQRRTKQCRVTLSPRLMLRTMPWGSSCMPIRKTGKESSISKETPNFIAFLFFQFKLNIYFPLNQFDNIFDICSNNTMYTYEPKYN